MKQHEWRCLIVRAATSTDTDLLDSLALHLAECEEAGTILQALGYGVPGLSIDRRVSLVPQNSDR